MLRFFAVLIAEQFADVNLPDADILIAIEFTPHDASISWTFFKDEPRCS